MNTTIRKIGNSDGVIIPKDLLDRLNLKTGDDIELRIVGDRLELIPQTAPLAEQLSAARSGMKKYKIALRELAK